MIRGSNHQHKQQNPSVIGIIQVPDLSYQPVFEASVCFWQLEAPFVEEPQLPALQSERQLGHKSSGLDPP